MAGPFEIATKAALKEILEKHVQDSKFGAFISPRGQSDLIDEVYDLLLTSRQLKSAGDRMISSGLGQGQSQTTARRDK